MGRGFNQGVWVVPTWWSGCWLGLLRPVPPVITFGVLSAARAPNQCPQLLFFRQPLARIMPSNVPVGWQATLAASHMEYLCVPRVCTAVITKSHNCLLLPRFPCCPSKDGISIVQGPVT